MKIFIHSFLCSWQYQQLILVFIDLLETLSPKISAADQSLKILQSGSFTVDVGSNVTTVTRNALSIRCNATGVPSPQITWSKDGSLLEATGPVYILQSLVLSDSGHYQCTASNVDGSDVQDIRIDVLGKAHLTALLKWLEHFLQLRGTVNSLVLRGMFRNVLVHRRLARNSYQTM